MRDGFLEFILDICEGEPMSKFMLDNVCVNCCLTKNCKHEINPHCRGPMKQAKKALAPIAAKVVVASGVSQLLKPEYQAGKTAFSKELDALSTKFAEIDRLSKREVKA